MSLRAKVAFTGTILGTLAQLQSGVFRPRESQQCKHTSLQVIGWDLKSKMGDKRQNKRRKRSKNNYQENLSPYENFPTSPQEQGKRKAPRAKSSSAAESGRVTRSRKTEVNNNAPVSSFSTDVPRPKARPGSDSYPQTVSTHSNTMRDMNGPKAKKTMGSHSREMIIGRQVEDSELFFSSNEESIDEHSQVNQSRSDSNNVLSQTAGKQVSGINVDPRHGSSLSGKSAQQITVSDEVIAGAALSDAPRVSSEKTKHNIIAENSEGGLGTASLESNNPTTQQQVDIGVEQVHDDVNAGDSRKNKPSKVLQMLATMNAKLQKIDVIEALALETKNEVTGVHSRIDTISEQLETVKADMKKKEGKWEAGVTDLGKKVAHIEAGCSKIEKEMGSMQKGY